MIFHYRCYVEYFKRDGIWHGEPREGFVIASDEREAFCKVDEYFNDCIDIREVSCIEIDRYENMSTLIENELWTLEE